MEDEALASESASTAIRVIEKESHLFELNDYSLHRGIAVGEVIESPEFVVCGRRWTIRFYLAGKTAAEKRSGFSSFYLCLKTETEDPVPVLFSIHFLDQSGNGNDIVTSLFPQQTEKNRQPFTARTNRPVGCPDFVKRKSIESPEYLKDDCLKMLITVGVVTSQIQTLPVLKVPPNSNTIRSDFGKLLQSKQGADVFFRVMNESFFAHKSILIARCPKLLSYCNQSTEEEINIPDIEPNVFKAMLWFAYTGILEELEEHDGGDFGPSILQSFMGKMLFAADRFEFKRLKRICGLRISKKTLSRESVAYVLHLAELCHAKELKEACLRFGADNGAARILDVMDYDGYKYLRETCPSLFVELAYQGSDCVNDQVWHKQIFSIVKESFAGILRTEAVAEEKHKMSHKMNEKHKTKEV